MSQSLNPIYLKYSQLISKSQVLRKKINKLNKIRVGHCMALAHADYSTCS